jgi:hypothetical protein
MKSVSAGGLRVAILICGALAANSSPVVALRRHLPWGGGDGDLNGDQEFRSQLPARLTFGE